MAKKSESKVLAEKPTADEGKLKALGLAMDQITKQFGDGSIMKLGEAKKVDVELLPSGSLSLDIALGGGYPKGRILEIYGPESSGKTTLTLHAIAEMQKQGGTAAFIDAEHALDPAYAKRLGVDTDNLLVSQPDNGEQALEIVETLVRSNAVDLIVVDSVAALVPQAEIDGDMGDSHMGLQARLMSQALRKLTGIINKSKATVIFINQIRMKIGVMFGNPETTTGGNALKFYASQRIDIRRIGQIKYIAKIRDALVVHYVKLCSSKWWCNLILHDLYLGAVADYIFTNLDLTNSTNINTLRGIELQSITASRGLWITKHYANLHTDLVNKYNRCL
jgi:recombination protein RecA